MRYIIIFLFLTLFLSACENTRHSIGLTGKPLATDGKFEDTLKLNYKIIPEKNSERPIIIILILCL